MTGMSHLPYISESGVPKTTLNFEDLIETLTELRDTIILMVMVYYSKRIPIKINKGNPEEIGASS